MPTVNEKARCRFISAERPGGFDQPRDQGRRRAARTLSFAALVVVGDPSAAVVGYGSGKAKEVPQAIRKGIESAKKNLMRMNLDPDHHSAHFAGTLRLRTGAAEAGARKERA